MELREKFLVKEFLRLKQKLEENLYYKHEHISKIYTEIGEYIKELSPGGGFIEELEDYRLQIKQKLDEMPNYLYTPYPEESEEGKRLKQDKREVERLTKIIDMLKKLLGEEIIEAIDKIELQKIIDEGG